MHRCTHPIHGLGTLIAIEGGKVRVTFDKGCEDTLAADAVTRLPELCVGCTPSDAPGRAVVRAQAVAIQSVQTRWGVFSPSRVRGLPHQLWVCQRVLADWPRSWLIADDVGLGKTIEAGLILSALLAADTVRRLLVICPASLVDQWQERLREMFDIRASVFSSDTEKSKTFWKDHSHVVASLHRLRLDNPRKSEVTRWERLFEAEPWDVVIVDEAHHLHADEQTGETLGLRLLKKMQSERKIGSLLLFTGTPHRGKHYGFAKLLGLLDPRITPNTPWSTVRERLPDLMIRNNKLHCTDFNGQRLFQPVTVETRAFGFSDSERVFFTQLAHFIQLGFAFSSGLDPRARRHHNLVLIVLLKLATSSTEAVKRAIQGRIQRLTSAGRAAQPTISLEGDLFDDWTDPEREAAPVDADALSLFEDVTVEVDRLRELLVLANAVVAEARVEEVLEIARGLGPDETLLMFTEYKSTQALLVSRLGELFGSACVTFINGDGRLVGVRHGHGPNGVLEMDRNTAAYGFNRGAFRFLVSTEAAGEGIDLHERCARLVHVDMPWNPMRMHQRVGRLNRIGQTRPVHVTILRNDESLEGYILGKLYEKLENIQAAFDATMADSEDIRSLVVGGLPRTSRLLSEALEAWFSAQTSDGSGGAFGEWLERRLATEVPEANTRSGELVDLVVGLANAAARFDTARDGARVPRLELSGLRNFMARAVTEASAPVESPPGLPAGSVLAFDVPPVWKQSPAAHFTLKHERRRQWMLFDRAAEHDAPFGMNSRLAGPGDRLFDVALAWAESLHEQCAVVGGLRRELALFVCLRPSRAARAIVRRVLVGAERDSAGAWQPLQDWQVLERLNGVTETRIVDQKPAGPAPFTEALGSITAHLTELGVHFENPTIVPFAWFEPAL